MTDSIVYTDNGLNTIETGYRLGEWTNELGKVHIKEWRSTGPKSYGYLTNKEKEVVKIKGFTLNYQNSKRLNFNSMKQIIDKEIDKVQLNYKMITRNAKNKTLVNQDTTKEFKFEYNNCT